MKSKMQFATFAIALVYLSSSAHAEESDVAKQDAQKLYQDAAHDIDQREYRRACPKLEAARKIMPGHVRTAMTLAECYDKLGQLATALEVFESAKLLASAEGKADKVSEIEKKLAEIVSRVPRLTISVPRNVAALPGLSIVRNGVPVSVTQWGKASPVNPGAYQIEVTALEKSQWRTSTEIQIGQTVTVAITPPWGVSARTPPNADADNKPSGAGSTSVSPTAQQGSGRRTAGFVGIGLGVAAVGVGAVLGGLAVSNNNASDDGHCQPNNVCDRIGFDLRTDARTIGNASTALFIVGGLATTVGVILVATSSSSKGEEARKSGPQTSLWIGPGTINMRGQW